MCVSLKIDALDTLDSPNARHEVVHNLGRMVIHVEDVGTGTYAMGFPELLHEPGLEPSRIPYRRAV